MGRVEVRFWKQESATRLSAGVSTLAHLLLISAWVVATLPSADPVPVEPDTHVWYLPPPDPKPARVSATESIRYVELAPEGLGSGMGAEGAGIELEVRGSNDPSLGDIGRDITTSAEQEGAEGTDSVFTIIEVDSVATRLPGSAAPKYPIELLEKRVEGQAIVQFVVDTTGFADLTSFNVVLASHPEFVKSVREALPGMRFSAARIGSAKVRQLVELPFSFNIVDPLPVSAESTKARTATKRRPE